MQTVCVCVGSKEVNKISIHVYLSFEISRVFALPRMSCPRLLAERPTCLKLRPKAPNRPSQRDHFLIWKRPCNPQTALDSLP